MVWSVPTGSIGVVRDVFRNRTFATLFAAQSLGLIGNGLTTMALVFLAFRFAGAESGVVISFFIIIKMIAFIIVAPVAGFVTQRWDRKRTLIALTVGRAFMVLALPFVIEIWQACLLIFIMHSATAAFAPVLQVLLSDVFPEEDKYTSALGLMRLSYGLEQLVSPLLAGILLSIVQSEDLFFGTVVAFLCAGALIATAPFPKQVAPDRGRPNILNGLRTYAATPRLRALFLADFAVAIAAATVFVNTVIFVQSRLGLSEQSTSLAFAFFGMGSIVAALSTPALLRVWSDRSAILLAAILLAASVSCQPLVTDLGFLLILWGVMGVGYGMALVPVGRVLRRSAAQRDRVMLFATQFMLTHICWLAAYAIVGWLSYHWGLNATALCIAVLSATATISVFLLWPDPDPAEIEHVHHDLPFDHPHFAEGVPICAKTHRHVFMVDKLHPTWPRQDGREGSQG